jgi:hypothetical protein
MKEAHVVMGCPPVDGMRNTFPTNIDGVIAVEAESTRISAHLLRAQPSTAALCRQPL